MPNRDLNRIQEALNALTEVQRNINELYYYKKYLNKSNHSVSACSSVKTTIDGLKQKHVDVVNALLFYGGSYQNADESLAGANNPDYQCSEPAYEFTYTSAPEHQKSGWEKFWNQIILGEFSEDVTWEGTFGSIAVSIVAGIFGVDAPLDIRDAAGNISKGEWGWALLDIAFLLPVVGAFKAFKYGDEVAGLAKHSDEFIEMGATVTKNSDNIIKSVYQVGDEVFEFTDECFDGIKNVDNIAITKVGDKLLWTTSTGRNYILDGDTFKIVDSSGEVVTSVDKVKVLPEFSYVKKSETQLTELRKAFNTTERTDFIKKLATDHPNDLKKLNLTDVQIEKMKKTGKVPTGFEVHHKLSLDDGGTNDFENLILIEDKYHDIFTFYQNSFTKTDLFNQKGYMIVDWVIPTGNVYIP